METRDEYKHHRKMLVGVFQHLIMQHLIMTNNSSGSRFQSKDMKFMLMPFEALFPLMSFSVWKKPHLCTPFGQMKNPIVISKNSFLG